MNTIMSERRLSFLAYQSISHSTNVVLELVITCLLGDRRYRVRYMKQPITQLKI
jgi:hypothetical protein